MGIRIAEDAAQDSLACEMEGVPTDSSNLVIKVIIFAIFTSPARLRLALALTGVRVFLRTLTLSSSRGQ